MASFENHTMICRVSGRKEHRWAPELTAAGARRQSLPTATLRMFGTFLLSNSRNHRNSLAFLKAYHDAHGKLFKSLKDVIG